jgi:cellulose synthase/poly-beta-1,6-N-acetylglucosamine synthase-like glycosyltransferase
MQGVHMTNEIKANLKQQTIWLRGLYMLMFALFYSVAEFVLFAVVVFQFLFILFTGKNNPRLLRLGQSLATYIYQILQFLTFNSDFQPYPFAEWPKD